MRDLSRISIVAALLALGVIASACTGDQVVPPSTTVGPATFPPSANPSVTTTESPPTTVGPAASSSTTTTSAPPVTVPELEAQVLRLRLHDGALATFDGSIETTLAWSGTFASQVLGGTGTTGSRIVTLEGRQRLLVMDTTGEAIEVVEEFSPRSGSVTTGPLDNEETTQPGKGDLGSFVPDTPMLIVDDLLGITGAGTSGASGFFIRLPDALLAAAIIGPPVSLMAVDVGDSWTWESVGTILGPIRLETSLLAEEELPTGGLGFVGEFSGFVGELPRELTPATAIDLLSGLLPPETLHSFEGSVPLSSATLRVAELSGTMRFAPAAGAPDRFTSTLSYVVDFEAIEDDRITRFTLEARMSRALESATRSEATPFERASILDRYSVGPQAAAEAAFLSLDAFTLLDPAEDEVEPILEAILDIREDLLAGVAVARVEDAEGESVIAVSVAMGGSFRGAPYMAEELATFLSALRPRRVAVASDSAFRVAIDEVEWLLLNDEAHLYIVIGDRSLSTRVMSDLAGGSTPYLWQPGDCLDFSDDFGSEVPHAPFGIHGLRHCGSPHVYEVIHSEALPEGPNSRFPSDMDTRSQAVCADAFVEFSGATELETVFSLIRYLPDDKEWAKASRYLTCVVSVKNAKGTQTLASRIDGRDEVHSMDIDVGTCMAGLFSVDCDDPHDREIIAALDAPGDPESARPSVRDLEQMISENCRVAFELFDLGNGPGLVQVFELTDLYTFWDQGSRRYYCMAVVYGDDGFPLEIIGNLGNAWQEAPERVVA